MFLLTTLKLHNSSSLLWKSMTIVEKRDDIYKTVYLLNDIIHNLYVYVYMYIAY